jgi:hypothetical protein
VEASACPSNGPDPSQIESDERAQVHSGRIPDNIAYRPTILGRPSMYRWRGGQVHRM